MNSFAVIKGSYDYGLVALSIVLAMFISYAALDPAGPCGVGAGGCERRGWAVAQRSGVGESG